MVHSILQIIWMQSVWHDHGSLWGEHARPVFSWQNWVVINGRAFALNLLVTLIELEPKTLWQFLRELKVQWQWKSWQLLIPLQRLTVQDFFWLILDDVSSISIFLVKSWISKENGVLEKISNRLGDLLLVDVVAYVVEFHCSTRVLQWRSGPLSIRLWSFRRARIQIAWISFFRICGTVHAAWNCFQTLL